MTRSYIATSAGSSPHLEAVLALEVDDLDRAGGRHLVDQLRRPVRRGVQLEAQVGMALEPAADRVERGRLAQAERVDEAQRARLETDHLVQRAARLVQRQVERGRLERPVAPAPRHVPLAAPPATGRSPPGDRTATRGSTRRPAAAPARWRAGFRPRPRTARRPRPGPRRRRRAGGSGSSPARSRSTAAPTAARTRMTRSAPEARSGGPTAIVAGRNHDQRRQDSSRCAALTASRGHRRCLEADRLQALRRQGATLRRDRQQRCRRGQQAGPRRGAQARGQRRRRGGPAGPGAPAARRGDAAAVVAAAAAGDRRSRPLPGAGPRLLRARPRANGRRACDRLRAPGRARRAGAGGRASGGRALQPDRT